VEINSFTLLLQYFSVNPLRLICCYFVALKGAWLACRILFLPMARFAFRFLQSWTIVIAGGRLQIVRPRLNTHQHH